MSVEPGKIRRAIGCMTGTSLDALDIALIRASGKGLSLSVTIEGFISVSLGDLAPKLRMVAEQHPFSAGELKKLEYDFSLFHLKAIQKLKKDRAIDLIILHGQTIYHNPPYSWQMINPSVIAHGLRVNTVHNLRAADLAIGGEGAPITPLADFILFRNKSMRTAIVNLGGFCNITTIPKFADNKINAESLFKWSRCITGKDICLCNQLLDRISRDGFKQEYDEGGKNAATGRILAKAYAELYGKLLLQSNSGKSLGSHDSTVGWFDNYSSVENPADLARTACAAIAAVICQDTKCNLMVLAGGGVHNKTLINELRRKATFRVQSSENYGINPSQREAVEIAVLGLLCQDRVPITLPQITGVMDSPVSGSWVLP